MSLRYFIIYLKITVKNVLRIHYSNSVDLFLRLNKMYKKLFSAKNTSMNTYVECGMKIFRFKIFLLHFCFEYGCVC